MSLNINPEALKWLNEHYPKLTYVDNPPIIKGQLEFSMVYLGDRYIINPVDPSHLNHKLYIRDSYEVEITLEKMPASILPGVKETGGRIKSVKEKYHKESLADVHMYNSEHLCLCARPEEESRLPNGFIWEDFFNNLLIPFFYEQSYFEKTGEWIWGERSHGCLGIFESYFDYRRISNTFDVLKKYILDLKANLDIFLYSKALMGKQKIKGHWLCFCGSRKKFRNCHNLAFRGMWNFKEDLSRAKIKLNQSYFANTLPRSATRALEKALSRSARISAFS